MGLKPNKHIHRTIILALILCCIPSVLQASTTDSDWSRVNALLEHKRKAAAENAAFHTQCSAAAVCLEVSRWQYRLGEEQAYRQGLIEQAHEILNRENFISSPWAFHDKQQGITILATQDMAYLFRHDGTDHVFLDSIYYYDATLGNPQADPVEHQRLFVRPSVNKKRPLWAVECSNSDHSNSVTLRSSDATGMSAPVIGGTNGQNAWVQFHWLDIPVPESQRHLEVKVKVEVYTGSQNVAGLSAADTRHGAWWIDVTHRSGGDMHIWQVEYPILERLEKFHRFDDAPAYLCLPKQTGAEVVVGETEDKKFSYNEYPGGVEFQFAAQYQQNAGLLYYCDDTRGYRKALQALDNDTGTCLTWIHYPKMQGHENAAVKLSDPTDLGYACRIGVFKGDWYDAAIWYRNNWLDKSFADFLPDSIQGGWLLDAHHGTYTFKPGYHDWLDEALDEHFPGNTCLGSHSAYVWRSNFKPEKTDYLGWYLYQPMVDIVKQQGRDYVYDPVPPKYPQILGELKTKHNLNTILYSAAKLICKLFHGDGEYPDSPQYMYNGENWAIRKPNGKQPNIPGREKGKLVSDFGFVCPACPPWRTLLAEQIEQMIARMGDNPTRWPKGVYLDVACTRPSYGGPCYNTEPGHGHATQRGGGNHYAVGTNVLLDAVSKAGKYGGKNPDFMVISEGNADVFLKHIDSYVHFCIGDDSVKMIPVSHVLWADKVRSYGGKCTCVKWGTGKCSPIKTARSFVYGIAMGRIKKNTFDADAANQLRAIKRMVWYRRSFPEFLARGRMYRPPQTDQVHNEVLCATWQSGNRVLFAFANGTESMKQVSATFDLNSCDIEHPEQYSLYEVTEKGMYEPEQKALRFGPSGTVQRSFQLAPLGNASENQGVLCFIAKKK